jgi:anti-anti-sigma factor
MKTGSFAIKDIDTEHFKTKSEYDGKSILVHVSGNADMQIHERLKTFLEGLDGEARRLGVEEAVLALHHLYFMNSTCLSLLMRTINQLIQVAGGSTYKLRFRSNPNLRWQKRSLQALSTLARGIVIVE